MSSLFLMRPRHPGFVLAVILLAGRGLFSPSPLPRKLRESKNRHAGFFYFILVRRGWRSCRVSTRPRDWTSNSSASAFRCAIIALMNKEIDYAALWPVPCWRARSAACRSRLIMYSLRTPFHALVVKPEIKSLPEIKGKVIGVATGTTEGILRAMMVHAGLDRQGRKDSVDQRKQQPSGRSFGWQNRWRHFAAAV